MPFRPVRAFVLAAALVALVAACAPAGVAPDPSSPVPAAPSPTPAPATPPLTGGVGNAGSPAYPELAVSEEPGRLVVSVTDPRARAWRIIVEGSGAGAGKVLEILLETGDVEYNVVVRSISDGRLVDENDLTGMVDDPTAAAGGCHPAMRVCYSSTGFILPADGDGRLEVTLDLPDPIGSLTVRGASSAWSEPFVLGPWRETEAFTTGG
jgi:hypothetical protein